MGKPKSIKNRAKTKQVIETSVNLTQESIQSNVLSLEHSLNDVIKRVNTIQKEGVTMTNVGQMEISFNKQMDSHVLAYTSLHMGQIELEENLKMAMQHVGLNPSP